MQVFGEKLAKAGWVSSFLITESGMAFSPTAKGQKRIKQIWGMIKELELQKLSGFESSFLFLMVAKEGKRLGWK